MFLSIKIFNKITSLKIKILIEFEWNYLPKGNEFKGTGLDTRLPVEKAANQVVEVNWGFSKNIPS